MGINEHTHIVQQDSRSSCTKIVIVGNGPVGVHFVRQLIGNGYPGHITIFGEEPFQPYNRVLLSSFLSGELGIDALTNSLQEHPSLLQQFHCKIVNIDHQNKTIEDQFGGVHHYDVLVLATGSSAFIPNISGNQKTGVYRFRDMHDAQSLYARKTRSRHTVVIGGGLLGLETAKSMLKYSTKVTVVQHSAALMNRQLDFTASQMVQAYAESNGIEFCLNCQVSEINGEQKVENVKLSTGEYLPCDTVIFTTGITPNTQLAFEAKISVRRGIQVNEVLRTSQEDIYAIGECADFEGQVYGLVAPGLEQASTLASNLCGGNSTYRGSKLMTELKVLGLSVFSMGKVSDEYAKQISNTMTYRKQDVYRKLFFSRGKLVGAVAIGQWSEIKEVQAAIDESRYIYPWHLLRFSTTGYLFGSQEKHILSYPDDTLVCNCQQVSVAQIRQELGKGECNFESLQASLGVASVCGTCKPLVQSALNQPQTKQPVKKALLAATFTAFVIACTLLWMPAIAPTQSVQQASWDWLWTDSLARQISGFTILGLISLSLLLSLKKRVKQVQWLSFDVWRFAHVTLAALGMSTLFIHTGISFGNGLNRLLAINFVLIILVGIASAVVAAYEGQVVTPGFKRIKRYLVVSHIVTFWPLPILLAFHILSVYYF
ncbi:MAG: FAD-dependent oxidoreductase [Aliiglaciecola sp.]